MIFTESLLYFFIPSLKNVSSEDLEHYLSRLQLEIVETKEYRLPKFKVAKVVSYSLIEDLKYRYELFELNTKKTYYLESNIPNLEVDRAVFFKHVNNSSKVLESELLSFSGLIGLKADDSVLLILDLTELDEDQLKELLSCNFYLPQRSYEVREIYRCIDFSTLGVLAQELSIVANLPLRSFDRLDRLFPDNTVGNFLLFLFLRMNASNLGKTYLENRESVLQILFGRYLRDISDNKSLETSYTNGDSKNSFNISNLLPIFRDLRENGEEKVVKKLSPFGFSFEQEKETDVGNIYGPIGYLTDNLPPINELLVKLISFSSKPREISLKDKDGLALLTDKFSQNSEDYNHRVIDVLLTIEAFFKSKGFIQCVSPKFVPVDRNLDSPKLVLAYNPRLTLRDNLHHPLFSILLENLSHSNKLYPLFELSYSAGKSTGKLGLASVTGGAISAKDEDSFISFTLEELQDLLRELSSKLKGAQLSFQREKHYLSNLNAALIFNIFVTVNEKELKIGHILVHRAEQLELKKQEVLSVELELSDSIIKI